MRPRTSCLALTRPSLYWLAAAAAAAAESQGLSSARYVCLFLVSFVGYIVIAVVVVMVFQLLLVVAVVVIQPGKVC